MIIQYLKKLINIIYPSTDKLKNEIQQTNKIDASKFNIVHFEGDAIVNAANSQLAPGGGVCGHIFAASDFDLLEQECSEKGPCNTGNAVITSSYGMNSPWIIHAVGPIYNPTEDKKCSELLYNTYKSSLIIAKEHNIKSIAFPAISTGIYGYPLDEATTIAVKAVKDFIKENPTLNMNIQFSCFDDKTLNCYKDKLDTNTVHLKKEESYNYD